MKLCRMRRNNAVQYCTTTLHLTYFPLIKDQIFNRSNSLRLL